MGLEPRATFAALFASINQHIEDLANQHKLRVVLLLDEAHLLPMQVLDQLHILLNFQRDSKPWLSIILVGLPELREILKRNVLQSLTGRIAIRVHLPPLDADQVKQYVRHRMTAAGCRREVFAGWLAVDLQGHRRHHAPHRRAGDALFGVGRSREVQPRGCHRCRRRHPRLCGGVVMNAATAPTPFPVVRPSDLSTAPASSAPWLIDQLWTAHAVGIIGGTPKSYKTWMALEMAVSVASGSA